MTLLKFLSPADYVTISNGAVGALGILYFIDGGYDNLLKGTILIFIAMFMDGLDGMVARKSVSKHNLGIYLDSMSDSISFCFAPAVFIYRMFYDIGKGTAFENFDNFLAVAATISIATLGITRLAIFTYFKEDKLTTFLGMPTPSMAYFVLVAGLLFKDHGTFLLPIIILVVIIMVINVQYPKIEGKLIIPALIGIFTGSVGAGLGLLDVQHYKVLLMISIVMIMIYIFSPLILTIKNQKIQGKNSKK